MELPHESIETVIRLGLAVLGGGAVGWNRERTHHPAGLRTLMLVSVGAAAFMIAGEGLGAIGVTGSTADRTRVLQGVVGGIGFLGAGTIMRAGFEVKGVTTAAAIWVVAAIGACFGMGMYVLAGATVVLTMLILWLSPVEAVVFHEMDPRLKPGPGDGKRAGEPLP